MCTRTDKTWQVIKKIIDSRDKKECRLLQCLTESEKKRIKGLMRRVDRAHVLAKKDRPDLIYNTRNVVTLNRMVHQRMDSHKDPVTGEPASEQRHWYWWWRILSKSNEKFKEDIDYYEKVVSYIGAR